MTPSARRKFWLAGASLAGLIGGAAPGSVVLAAEAGEGASVETVVVTARRREEALQEVPVTVTAVQGDQLRKSGITELRDIVALIPNAVIQDNPESYNVFVNIRGMRIVDVQAEPNVGLYRNGMYMGGHRANLGAQVDVSRVEVLRGPQGGFYGRSSVGGTVDIIYATPQSTFGGYAKATIGSYEQTRLEGAVNMPINDQSALRITGWSFNQAKSELYNTTLSEYVGAYTDRGVRLGYSLEIGDRTRVTWMAETQDATGPSMKTYAPFGISNFGAVSPVETPEKIRRDTRSDAAKNQLYLSQALTHDFDAMTLTVNASYKRYKFKSIQDSDQTAIGPEMSAVARQTDILRREATDSYFLEAILGSKGEGPLNWQAGASYFNESFDFARTIRSRRNTPAFGIQTALIGFPKLGTEVQTKSASVFGTLGYQVTDRLSLEASLRYSEDKKDLAYLQGVLPSGSGNAALDAYFNTILSGPYPPLNLNSKSKFTNWSPSLTARFRFTPDIIGYASYSTGFRPGAFNLSPTTPETIPYGQETARNYEAGVKGTFLDGRVTANAAVFYMRQDDLLLAQTTQLAGVDRTYLANVGTANTYGVELEGTARPTDWLQVSASVGWLDPKFDHAVANPGKPSQQILDGKIVPYTREWTWNLIADVNRPITDRIDLVGNLSYRHEQGGLLGDYYVIDPYETMNKVDISAGVVVDQNIRVTAYVKNLNDEHISQFWFYNRGTNTSEGRTFGVDLSYRF